MTVQFCMAAGDVAQTLAVTVVKPGTVVTV